MLIRRPAGEVFEAFADPAVTSRFWFTKGSGRLERGAKVRWDWEMYGVGTDVLVKAVEPGRRILIDWDTADAPTEVEWLFEARGADTFATVENRGFEDSPAGVAKALDSTGGFNLVMAAAKFWLEHGIDPRIIEDAHAAHRLPEWMGRA
ncbi:hypothetical protein ASD25_09810 [Brevundimonas sp. Root1423]|nr:hypothetical protein ASD25_09810 [Brevundimonas sp. Root1423]